MGSFKLKRLQLPQNFVTTFEKQNIYSCRDALCLTLIEIQYLLSTTRDETLNIISIISNKCVSKPQTVYEIYQNERRNSTENFFPTLLCDLDLMLHGGLLAGSITEIAGPPGVGKTQFCLMLSLLATLPVNVGGFNGQVIYIDTESTFSAFRLKQMAHKKFPNIFKCETDYEKFLQCISVYAATTVVALKEILSRIEQDIIRKSIKLIIVDSIASLFRKEYGASVLHSVIERNNILLQQAAVLKDIAQTYKIVVFVTNQITSHSVDCSSILGKYFLQTASDAEDDVATSGLLGFNASQKLNVNDEVIDTVIPALGSTWSHCVNTRLLAQFLDNEVRQLVIAKSPVAPNAAVKYILDETGVVLIGHDVECLETFNAEHQNIHTKYDFLSRKAFQ